MTFYDTAVGGEVVTRKIVLTFLSCDFTIVTADGLLSGFIDKYKVHSLFIVSRLSTEIQLVIQGLLIVMGKATRSTCLHKVKYDWTFIFGSEPTGRIFYLHAAILKIPKLRFIIKPPAC